MREALLSHPLAVVVVVAVAAAVVVGVAAISWQHHRRQCCPVQQQFIVQTMEEDEEEAAVVSIQQLDASPAVRRPPTTSGVFAEEEEEEEIAGGGIHYHHQHTGRPPRPPPSLNLSAAGMSRGPTPDPDYDAYSQVSSSGNSPRAPRLRRFGGGVDGGNSSDTSCDEYGQRGGGSYTPRSAVSEFRIPRYRAGSAFAGFGRGMSPSSFSEPVAAARRAPSTDSFFGKHGATVSEVGGGSNSQLWYQQYKHSSFSQPSAQTVLGEPVYGAFDGRITNIRGNNTVILYFGKRYWAWYRYRYCIYKGKVIMLHEAKLCYRSGMYITHQSF